MNDDSIRSPYDGEPYYCASCGMGFGEYMACEVGEPECALETPAAAEARRREQLLREARAH